MKPTTVARYAFFFLIVPVSMFVFNGLLSWIYPKLLSNGYLASLIASGIVGLLLYISARIIQLVQAEQG